MTSESLIGELNAVTSKMDAIAIILGSPLWPERELLSDSGTALHDAILNDAKEYALALSGDDFTKAFKIASAWPADQFMESTLINDPDVTVREANHRMLAVYQYYLDAMGFSWKELL